MGQSAQINELTLTSFLPLKRPMSVVLTVKMPIMGISSNFPVFQDRDACCLIGFLQLHNGGFWFQT
jgi:hypothetical protein